MKVCYLKVENNSTCKRFLKSIANEPLAETKMILMILSVCHCHCESKCLVSLTLKSVVTFGFTSILEISKLPRKKKNATYHVTNDKIVSNLNHNWPAFSFNSFMVEVPVIQKPVH